MKRTSMRDVAARAGVSTGTVSNVLNGLPSVDAVYVERVNRAVAELGFVPNASARQLKMGASNTINMVVMSASSPFYGALAEQIDTLADQRNLRLLVASSAQREGRQRAYLELFEQQRSYGILVVPLSSIPDMLRSIHERGTPVVILGDHVDSDGFCSVGLDTEASGYLACTHLLDRGRRRIAVVGGPAHQVRGRIDGARRAVSERTDTSFTHFDTSDLTVSTGAQAGSLIAAMPAEERPDGVFCANDLVAIGLINALMTAGVSVPHDVAVIGHDDIEFAETNVIPLTTIRQPVSVLADEAVMAIEREVTEGVHHQHATVRVPPELVIRDSTSAR